MNAGLNCTLIDIVVLFVNCVAGFITNWIQSERHIMLLYIVMGASCMTDNC